MTISSSFMNYDTAIFFSFTVIKYNFSKGKFSF